eukprot:COSAG06_NODE_2416_length_6912_cov_11.801409_4_plen_243_part_00
MIILPLQARDKHRESTQKTDRFLAGEIDLRDERATRAGQGLVHQGGGAAEERTNTPLLARRSLMQNGPFTETGSGQPQTREQSMRRCRRRSLSFRCQVARLAKTESFGLRRHLSCLADLKRQHPPTVPVDGKLQVRACGRRTRRTIRSLFSSSWSFVLRLSRACVGKACVFQIQMRLVSVSKASVQRKKRRLSSVVLLEAPGKPQEDQAAGVSSSSSSAAELRAGCRSTTDSGSGGGGGDWC